MPIPLVKKATKEDIEKMLKEIEMGKNDKFVVIIPVAGGKIILPVNLIKKNS